MNNLIFDVVKASYNNVAPFYDLLSRLVFGNAILEAHSFLVNSIPANSSVLIVGGGTGYILEEIAKKHHSGLRIIYVDISEKMIGLSKQKHAGNNLVTFINRPVLDVTFTGNFDVVITPFFFDNFSNDTARIIFDKINVSLRPEGLWLFADFILGKEAGWWQKLLLKSMYIFFKISCGIEASRLPDTDLLFDKHGYKIIGNKTFYRDFIYAVIYSKD